MIGIEDYGDNGVVPIIESDDAGTAIESILEYVEARFDILDKMKDRDGDIMALCQEFYEWGSAEAGDHLSYYTVPTFE